MSRPISQTGTETLIPSSYTAGSGMTTSSSYPTSNGLANSSSTNYAQLSAPNGSLGYCFYEIDTSAIPENATSVTVSCSVKISVSNSSGYSTAEIQLYSGNTAKGSAISFYNSTSNSVRTMTTGTWTRSELSNARLRISGQKNTNSNRYIRFYGATITIDWTVSGTEYELAVVNNSSSITTVPSDTSYIFQNEDTSVIFDNVTSLDNISITDNGNDIKSNLVHITPYTSSLQINANNVISSSGTISSSYPTSNSIGKSTSNTSNYTRLQLASSVNIIYGFDVSDIPSDVAINSISCSVRAYVTSTSSSISTKKVQLYSGSTAKGSSYTLPTSNSVFSVTPGTWTRSELDDIRLRFDGAYSGSSSYYIRIYGIDITINYGVNDEYYIYTISNISADHTIIIADASSQKSYIKVNGNWIQASKVYKKVSGNWIEQSDFSSLFSGSDIWIKKE